MKTIIYIKVIIYGSQAPFRVNITECFKTFMNQARHHHRAEKYYLYIADERSKAKLRKHPNVSRRWKQEPGGWHCSVFMSAIFVHMPSAIHSACETVDF